jgi:hypothetical protein
MTPARHAALIQLLTDWEAGKMTEWTGWLWRDPYLGLCSDGLVASRNGPGWCQYCLTPAGLALARQAREETPHG